MSLGERAFCATVSLVSQSCPTLQPYGLQHARLPCPSPTPGAYSNSCPFNLWCHPTISSSVFPFSSCLQSLPAPWSVSQFFISGGQRIGDLASVLPMNIQDWLPLGLVGSPCSSRDSQESSPNHSSKASILLRSAFFIIQPSHPYMTTGKTIDFSRWTFDGKVMSLLFNMLSRFVTAFLPRSKHLFFMAAVSKCSDFGVQRNSVSMFPLFPYLFATEWWDWMSWS